MRKLLIVVLLGLVVAAVAMGWFLLKGPDLSSYEPLVDPRITTMPDQKMIQVELKGDPNAVGADAFGLLFSTYFDIDGTPKGPNQPAPRARWPIGDDVPADQWVGQYAMPVPETTHDLPEGASSQGLTVELLTWAYGDVAEILHKGPYDAETPTIDRLTQFVADNGYSIVGAHEEEYVRGPGMLLPVSPDDYYTIIRYRVEKDGANTSSDG